jgi:hypothetical protein
MIAGELVGYRCWKVVSQRSSIIVGLKSVVYDYWWKYRSQTEDGTCEAEWLHDEYEVARLLKMWFLGIRCERDALSEDARSEAVCEAARVAKKLNSRSGGFYSFKDPLQAFTQMRSENIVHNGHVAEHTVLGTIWCWGAVAEHQVGYRSQFAAVRGIDDVFPRNQWLLESLRQLYGVQGSEKAV